MTAGEDLFYDHLALCGYQLPEREYRFCERRWRFDFAFVEQKIAVEIEGGQWINGRHTRPQGYQNDIEKYNAAARLGWKVYRFTPDMVESGEAIKFMDLLELQVRPE